MNQTHIKKKETIGTLMKSLNQISHFDYRMLHLKYADYVKEELRHLTLITQKQTLRRLPRIDETKK